MLSRITWITLPLLTIALALMTNPPQADAGGFSFSFGRAGIGNYGHHGHRNHYRSYRVPSYRSYYPGYQSNFGRRYYHPRRPHLDYHGPTLVPHGNHLDLIPGHYDLHYGNRHH